MLLTRYKDADETGKETHKNNILSLIDGQVHLRSKRELIEKFWEEEKKSAYDALCKEENLKCDEERIPLKDDVAKTLNFKPKLLERKKIVPRVLDKIVGFIDKFYDL